MSRSDEAINSFIKQKKAEIAEREKKEREAFGKLSPDEKIEKLIERIDNLSDIVFDIGCRHDELHHRLDELVKKYNRLASYLKSIAEERGYVEESKVVSTEKIVCKAREGEVHTAILLIHGNGTTTVKCKADCYDCEYKL